MNKITTLDHINDLAIQYYELRREKKKQKLQAKKDGNCEKKEKSVGGFELKGKVKDYLAKMPDYVKFGVVGSVGVVVVCVVGYKWWGVVRK